MGSSALSADDARIEEEIDKGLHSLAVRELSDFLVHYPDSHEAAYWLGACEKTRGRPQAAIDAWARVPTSSTFWPRSAEGRVALEIERGRVADAEQLIKDLKAGSHGDESDASILLGPIYCQQGRLEEAKQLIEARWDQLNKAGEALWKRPSTWFAFIPRSSLKRCRSKQTATFFTRLCFNRPMTIESGWEKRTWRSAPARSMRLQGGSMPVCSDVPMMWLSGVPAWTGAWRQMTSKPSGKR